MIEGVLLASILVGGPPPAPQTTHPRLERDARHAAARYQSALLHHAPQRPGPGLGPGACDEVIGRFCFRFTDREDGPPDDVPEDPIITRARSRGIQAYRAWMNAAPYAPDAAGPLVRYLLEAGRPQEAVAAARTHAAGARESPASLLLLGLAYHESGEFASAELVFDRARSGLPAAERRRLDGLEALLEPEERRTYVRLPPEVRDAYEGRFWRFSDPSFLEPGNERRSAHYARHVMAGLLAAAPRVAGGTSWGADVEEVLIRYGAPVHRERVRPPPGRPDRTATMIRHYDRHAASFVPSALLTAGLVPEPEPGGKPPLELARVRSSYAPVRLHRASGLSVQRARFPTRHGAVLVVVGRLAADTVAGRGSAPRALLAVLDTLGREVTRTPGEVRYGPDGSLYAWAEIPLPAGEWVYRLELADHERRRLGLAQHPVAIEPPGAPSLSDLLVASAGAGAGEPSSRRALVPADLVVEAGPIRVWAEAGGLARAGGEARYATEWWVEGIPSSSVLAAAAAWVGRRLGLVETAPATRVRWRGGSVAEPVPLTVMLDLTGLEPGLYRVGLAVTDELRGVELTASRRVRVVLPGSASRDRE